MSSIHILSKNLANQIAAGEVIERPFSIVKELVENSLDAGASEIRILLEQGGKQKIEVIDNGAGMDRADALLALERFATSKITNEDDLFRISTFGFRGEALPSIASVSILTLQTSTEPHGAGTEVRVKGGEREYVKDTAFNLGTRMLVEHLFYNIPARQKYLKSDATELSHIVEYVSAIALAHPACTFGLFHNGKKVFDLVPRDTVLMRVMDIFGSEGHVDNFLPLDTKTDTFHLEGIISHPRMNKNSAKYEFLYVNNRPIKSPLIHRAVAEGYGVNLEKGAYPFFVLNLKLDPSKVDVNVHPRKLEVRFEQQQLVFDFFKRSIAEALNAHFPADTNVFGTIPSDARQGESVPSLGRAFSRYQGASSPRSPYARSFRNSSSADAFPTLAQRVEPYETRSSGFIAQVPDGVSEVSKIVKPKILGQLHTCYIILESPEGFSVVDQHAAHEITLFHEIRQRFSNHEVVSQPLLFPLGIDIAQARMALFTEFFDFFRGAGFEVDQAGKYAILVHAVPAVLGQTDVEKLMADLVEDLAVDSTVSLDQKYERLFATMACRAAVKFGDPLSVSEQEKLIAGWSALENGYTCPHGRPVVRHFSLSEMLKWFKRPG